ncbi:GtrA family protein [uncultured Draconibacterium sp.]|uniref:GtrA family protein n=1 Tax=uncultured Draconibacterium sp. TaxID=1573823 RepID=UPI00374A418E
MKREIKGIVIKFIKFAKVGAFVTFLSLGLNYFFLKIVSTPLLPTYIILYLLMISLSFFLNSKYTFKAERSIKQLIMYYGSYCSSMLLGVALLSIFKILLPFENWILAYMVVPFTMTSNFILSSLIFKKHE